MLPSNLQLTNDAIVSVVMGSRSDWPTMAATADLLGNFQIPYEKFVVSAHRTPEWMFEFAQGAESRGVQIIIAAAGGAAHLPGMIASLTRLPVLGVPIESKALKGVDSLLSIAQMPGGIPVGTLAIGSSGAKNAAILAARILANQDRELQNRLEQFMQNQSAKVLEDCQL